MTETEIVSIITGGSTLTGVALTAWVTMRISNRGIKAAAAEGVLQRGHDAEQREEDRRNSNRVAKITSHDEARRDAYLALTIWAVRWNRVAAETIQRLAGQLHTESESFKGWTTEEVSAAFLLASDEVREAYERAVEATDVLSRSPYRIDRWRRTGNGLEVEDATVTGEGDMQLREEALLVANLTIQLVERMRLELG